MKTIIIDMMGGDNAPHSTVKGVAKAKEEYGADISYILVGDTPKIEAAAKEEGLDISGLEIVHTDVEITMEDDPLCVVKGKENSSMSVGLKLLKEGRGDAFVSAGNTGALFTGATLIVKKIKGVKRPAISALLPFQPPVLLVDSGANVVVTPEYLEQFAVLGTAYMHHIMGVENPRVGLLNNGAEEHKGTELQIETYKKLAANTKINFVGNVEGNTVMKDSCDIVVADGFTGNIFLKTMEGIAKMLMKELKATFYKNLKTKAAAALVKDDIYELRKNFDAGELGGAPILGISKPVIKAHGSSNSNAFKNAIRQAIAFSESNINADIEAALSKEETKITEENGD